MFLHNPSRHLYPVECIVNRQPVTIRQWESLGNRIQVQEWGNTHSSKIESEIESCEFPEGSQAAHCAQAFERLLFRATRGNMYLRNATVGTVVDPITTEKQEKAVFVVFFAGERARIKILKVCAPLRLALERFILSS